eukprot:3310302-Karenia_brevis.AAC.1
MIKVVGRREQRRERERQRKADIEFRERMNSIHVCSKNCCKKPVERAEQDDRERYVCGVESGDG